MVSAHTKTKSIAKLASYVCETAIQEAALDAFEHIGNIFWFIEAERLEDW